MKFLSMHAIGTRCLWRATDLSPKLPTPGAAKIRSAALLTHRHCINDNDPAHGPFLVIEPYVAQMHCTAGSGAGGGRSAVRIASGVTLQITCRMGTSEVDDAV